MAIPFFISIPHSGEKIPDEAFWLKDYDEVKLMFDVDRYVDRIYKSAIDELKIKSIFSPWHRYAVDLNRFHDEVGPDTVEGALKKENAMSRGIHWPSTTKNHTLLSKPITQQLHKDLINKYYKPFHNDVESAYSSFFKSNCPRVFQLDAHSMPSVGTQAHKDPGANRAEVVISDFQGDSCDSDYKEIVVNSFKKVGFDVEINWPYVGGRITQIYGKPEKGQNCIQVELNRSIYMNEETKQIEPAGFAKTENLVKDALNKITEDLLDIC